MTRPTHTPIYWKGRSNPHRRRRLRIPVRINVYVEEVDTADCCGPVQSIDMIDIELSCGLPPGPDFADLAVLAEELGYARVWIFDSAPLWEDPFVHLALAARRTTRIGLATAVLIPSQRSVMAMASGIATIARISGHRFRACFGTGATARWTLGQSPMTLGTLFDYVGSLRRLLAGETVVIDGKPVRMLHWPGMTAARPVRVPLWLSVMGPRGNERAHEVADGIIGPPHPTLPTATMMAGTVLDVDENPRSEPGAQRRGAVGRNPVAHRLHPWRCRGSRRLAWWGCLANVTRGTRARGGASSADF